MGPYSLIYKQINVETQAMDFQMGDIPVTKQLLAPRVLVMLMICSWLYTQGPHLTQWNDQMGCWELNLG